MTTHTAVQASSPTLGQRVFRINAFFSGMSGLALILAASPIASFIGVPSPLALAIVGIGLLGFALYLYWLARRAVTRTELIGVGLLDLAWVIGSALLLLSGWLALTTAGQWTVALTAEIVFWFAVAEFFAAWRMGRQ